jgi:hypothetical protein
MSVMDDLKTERITTMMSPSDVKAIDDWAFANRIRSRGEAIRRLIETGLQSAQVAPKEGSDKPAEKTEPGKRSPRAKPLAMSKEAQIPALREWDA